MATFDGFQLQIQYVAVVQLKMVRSRKFCSLRFGSLLDSYWCAAVATLLVLKATPTNSELEVSLKFILHMPKLSIH
jgi:hypothetical protein